MEISQKRKARFSGMLAIIMTICLLVTYIPAVAMAAEKQAGTGLKVGASIKDITPTAEMYPLTRNPGVTLVGVIDSMHVRCIAMNDGERTSLIISFETGRGPYGPQFLPILAEHTGIPAEAIFFAATHSHAVPEITSTVNLEGDTNNAKWGRLVRDKMLEAADEALLNMEAAKVGIGYSDSYTNVNRNYRYTNADGSPYYAIGYNGSGFSDKKLTAVEFVSIASGKPIAFITSHATHGVVMHQNQFFDPEYEGINYTADKKFSDAGMVGVSSDIPGYVSTYLENKFEGSVSIWLCGAAGDQNPVVMNEIYTPSVTTGEQEISHIRGGDVGILEYLAKIQFADVLRALDSIEEYKSDVKVAYAFGVTEVPPRTGTTPIAMHLKLTRIGDIAFVGTAGEFYNSIGVYMRENSLLKHTTVINCVWHDDASARVAYFPDDDGILNGSANTAPYAYGYINNALTDLMNSLIRETDDMMQSKWTYSTDGTAVNNETGEIAIVGLDGIVDTEDDNRIVNPAGKVLLENAVIDFDGEGLPYVDLGNGFNLYGGDDGKIGTIDDVIIGFGSYPQSDATGVVKDPISWRLLDIEDGKAILLSKYILDGIQFNILATDGNDWATSNYRSWLNSNGGKSNSGNEEGFYDTAFNNAEKEKILLTDLQMDSKGSFIAYNTTKSSDWWEIYTTHGENTSDYVWALSGEEAFEYFGRSKIASFEELGHDPANYTNGYFKPTEFARQKANVSVNTGGNGPSFVGYGDTWTRSPGRDVDESGNYYGVFWGTTGSLNSGRPVTRGYGAFPAITVDLKGENGAATAITDISTSARFGASFDAGETDIDDGAFLIIAQYDINGKMMAIGTKPISAKGVTELFVSKAKDCVTARAFAWDKNLIPIVKAIDLKNEFIEGVTVEKDAASPTGYTATFVYKNDTANKVEIDSKVLWFHKDDQANWRDPKYTPHQWQKGMFAADSGTYQEELENIGNGYWMLTLPLPSGAFSYRYRVTAGTSSAYILDPANLPSVGTGATGQQPNYSMVYMPFDPEKQDLAEERAVEMPVISEQKGKVEHTTYVNAIGRTRPLAVYLPKDYDANRSEPYKVLYLSHGQGGHELDWMIDGSVPNILDNMIADGKIEPFIAVSMSWQGEGGAGFDTAGGNPVNVAEIMGYIIPAMESKYNVSREPSGRSMAGLSAGAGLSSHVWMKHPDQFGYFGFFSAGSVNNLLPEAGMGLEQPSLMVGIGKQDTTRYEGNQLFMQKLDNLGIDYVYHEENGAHDWRLWPRMLAYYLENVLWKSSTEYIEGATVQKDESSPTGYTATFVYKDATAANVYLQGDAMYFADDKFKENGKLYTPYEWEKGMFPISGLSRSAPTEEYPYEVPATPKYNVAMEKIGDDIWTVTVPLPSGAYKYCYYKNGNGQPSNGTKVLDPANLPLLNTDTNTYANFSIVYMPFDAEKQDDDRSITLPRNDKNGSIVFETFTEKVSGKDSTVPIAIYLPYGYDKDRTTPYKVFYLSHGGGGHERDWTNDGAMPNIMDNMIAEGRLEETIVVAVNFSPLGNDHTIMAKVQKEHVIPLLETKYNASVKVEDRAYAGLSRGGEIAGWMMVDACANPDEYVQYGIWGIWSARDVPTAELEARKDNAAFMSELKKLKIIVDTGFEDEKHYRNSVALVRKLGELGVNVYQEPTYVSGGHDWMLWPKLLESFAEALWS